jgi:ABC-type uncharacterized transport system ATPase subunit
MRRGTMVATVKTAETSPEALAELMVGRKVLLEVDKGPAKTGDVVLSVEDLRVRDEHKVERLKGVSFDIRAGRDPGHRRGRRERADRTAGAHWAA